MEAKDGDILSRSSVVSCLQKIPSENQSMALEEDKDLHPFMPSTSGPLWAEAILPLGKSRECLKILVFSKDSQLQKHMLMTHPWASSIINNETTWVGLSTGLSLVSSEDTCCADRESRSRMWHIKITIFLGKKWLTCLKRTGYLNLSGWMHVFWLLNPCFWTYESSVFEPDIRMPKCGIQTHHPTCKVLRC